jgi:hypothetical protein
MLGNVIMDDSWMFIIAGCSMQAGGRLAEDQQRSCKDDATMQKTRASTRLTSARGLMGYSH